MLCSGKVYYDLLDEREKLGVDDVYLLRLEQFYPWPMKSLSTELARFKTAELVWCQEEPKNMGGWTFVDPWLELTLAKLKVDGHARALCRAPGVRLHGRRPDEPPYEGTGDLPGGGVRLIRYTPFSLSDFNSRRKRAAPP